LPGPWGIDRHAEDVAELITASGPWPVVLVGHSMGGFVAAALIRRFPDLVSSLVLVDGGLPFSPPLDVDQAIEQTLGPALERLQQTFPAGTPTADSGKPTLRCERPGATPSPTMSTTT
jgi:pimeloyl-ACP methyl ester carboxylesterase